MNNHHRSLTDCSSQRPHRGNRLRYMTHRPRWLLRQSYPRRGWYNRGIRKCLLVTGVGLCIVVGGQFIIATSVQALQRLVTRVRLCVVVVCLRIHTTRVQTRTIVYVGASDRNCPPPRPCSRSIHTKPIDRLYLPGRRSCRLRCPYNLCTSSFRLQRWHRRRSCPLQRPCNRSTHTMLPDRRCWLGHCSYLLRCHNNRNVQTISKLIAGVGLCIVVVCSLIHAACVQARTIVQRWHLRRSCPPWHRYIQRSALMSSKLAAGSSCQLPCTRNEWEGQLDVCVLLQLAVQFKLNVVVTRRPW